MLSDQYAHLSARAIVSMLRLNAWSDYSPAFLTDLALDLLI